jgi:hypothetical protein
MIDAQRERAMTNADTSDRPPHAIRKREDARAAAECERADPRLVLDGDVLAIGLADAAGVEPVRPADDRPTRERIGEERRRDFRAHRVERLIVTRAVDRHPL